jgi:hypothetical protein
MSLADVLKTLSKVRACLDHDEDGAGFEVEHNEHCPSRRRVLHFDGSPSTRKPCACGLADMIDDLKAAEAETASTVAKLKAEADAEAVRLALQRCAGLKTE